MANSRVRRGRKTQELIAEYLHRWGYEEAEPVPASLPGRDIRKVPGLAPEVKASRDGKLTAAVKQAVSNAGDDLPIVIWRPDGYGPEKIDDWLVVMRLEDFMGLWDQLEIQEIRRKVLPE